MILIVDSGSTKCDWISVDTEGNQLLEKIRTNGLNPAILSQDELRSIILESPELSEHKDKVSHLYFYGAGCGTDKPRELLEGVLGEIFPKAYVDVQEDTMAAVRATQNSITEAAVVCILGTGSNCSYFDGEFLHQRVKSLGYTLMDDASGNYFGKQLIRDYYFDKMPEDIRVAFASKYDLEADVIKSRLYKQPNPNAYLANFAEFMFLNKDSEYIQEVITSGIRLFMTNMVFQFDEELKNVPLHFAGSIAYFSQNEINKVAEEFGYKTGNFVRRPIEGLVKYHTD
ncbi:MAG: N-acetylglucosamine kinase [Bacteroidetes bacterium MedPE-SWsnd-G2]|nr:MAG: N-acetylglucosamine kinase [Bacteroidetes bacterium MedPE-SWsnd-G2]